MRKAWLAAGGTVVALLLAEGICRMVVDDPIGGTAEYRDSWRVVGLAPDPQLEFGFQPGYEGRMTLAGEYDVPFRINAQGLREDHEIADEHPGTTRILLVGDSFVFGVGVALEDTLGKQLERALNETTAPQAASAQPPKPARPVEVVAVGVPSYGLDAYALLIERWVPRLQPDLVLVALYPGNDLLDYGLKATDPHVVIEGMLVGQRQAWSWNLRRWSTLAHIALQRFNPHPRIEQYRPDKPTPADLARILASTQPWIARIAAAQRPGGPPIVLTLCQGRRIVQSWRDGELAACVPPINEVLAQSTRLGLELADPKPAWLAPELKARECFFARDSHYTPAGNRLLGGWLATRLREQHPEVFGAR